MLLELTRICRVLVALLLDVFCELLYFLFYQILIRYPLILKLLLEIARHIRYRDILDILDLGLDDAQLPGTNIRTLPTANNTVISTAASRHGLLRLLNCHFREVLQLRINILDVVLKFLGIYFQLPLHLLLELFHVCIKLVAGIQVSFVGVLPRVFDIETVLIQFLRHLTHLPMQLIRVHLYHFTNPKIICLHSISLLAQQRL